MAAEKAAQGGAERLAHAQSALAEAEAQPRTAVQAQAALPAAAPALESGVAAAARWGDEYPRPQALPTVARWDGRAGRGMARSLPGLNFIFPD